MKKQTRFLKSIVDTARANQTTPMPWSRGTARAGMIDRRRPAPVLRRA
ncbi:hypothetical protein [Sagittula salina]|uniref:Uncharacterized protein n=1 Tax=Sagittula salina TaxID=2820268 RepID=A0A940MPG7_9RHOB|nr:hypothetical protein [Sagittula salina]MBP0482341.1 hypothetical protein [Sagittula salina]